VKGEKRKSLFTCSSPEKKSGEQIFEPIRNLGKTNKKQAETRIVDSAGYKK
jgi:hypothetical protein